MQRWDVGASSGMRVKGCLDRLELTIERWYASVIAGIHFLRDQLRAFTLYGAGSMILYAGSESSSASE
jgi:hypothetical protein